MNERNFFIALPVLRIPRHIAHILRKVFDSEFLRRLPRSQREFPEHGIDLSAMIHQGRVFSYLEKLKSKPVVLIGIQRLRSKRAIIDVCLVNLRIEIAPSNLRLHLLRAFREPFLDIVIVGKVGRSIQPEPGTARRGQPVHTTSCIDQKRLLRRIIEKLVSRNVWSLATEQPHTDMILDRIDKPACLSPD